MAELTYSRWTVTVELRAPRLQSSMWSFPVRYIAQVGLMLDPNAMHMFCSCHLFTRSY